MALPSFALVEWKGDPKPDCWQVIKTSQIQANHKDIKEGNAVDALWRRDEESSVAEILKLSDSKSYLNSIRENEFAKPWREQLPTKRVPVQKKSHVHVTNEESASGKSTPDSSQTNKRRNPMPASHKASKKQKKEKSKKEDVARASYYQDDDMDQPQPAILASKSAAEKVLAKKFLQRPRVDPQENATKIPSNAASVSVAGTSGDIEVECVFNDDTLDADGSDGGSTAEDTRESVCKQSQNMRQGCCKSCVAEFAELKESISNITDELAIIKRKLRKLKRSQPAEQDPQVSQSTELEKECRLLLGNSTSLFKSVSILLRKLFSVDKILNSSVSGKAPNSKTVAKPKFDGTRLDLLRSLCLEVHKETNFPQITAKIQAVQKAVKRENCETVSETT